MINAFIAKVIEEPEEGSFTIIEPVRIDVEIFASHSIIDADADGQLIFSICKTLTFALALKAPNAKP